MATVQKVISCSGSAHVWPLNTDMFTEIDFEPP